ncbi:MAG: hypothetical protein LBC20_17220 [Planctomycetaceae bacterium]|nr:hypothetical protein [Planctomycetaceae bacterium]
MIRNLFFSFFCLSTILFCGCASSGLPVNFVEGTVIFNAQPLSDALISFIPKIGGNGIPAIGKTDENGHFFLTSMQGGQPNQGAVAAEYIVVITKNKDKPSRMEYSTGIDGKPMGIGIYESFVPEKYTLPTTSNLIVTVEKKKRNQFNFVLDKK